MRISFNAVICLCATFVVTYGIWTYRNIRLWEITHPTTCVSTENVVGLYKSTTCK